ncbi:C4-dicarboxylate transporter/malic acid transport protein [Nautilia profundicola AmH]|uniref:C4-dicarboxylate transporter/malic acid transport protein n=1 Tax=Nautilia profundicola (strain ATCC BAA-1463 / DSM 18972 / AmH) TaxID=598659 RepID=B9L8F1_NAUPA|nr:SLAC1 anion channel family protein [Nautilia profundicola]ACM93207.1 C4-dicarboxylate transporter/malic acid transport protein [Nautilia profundicola AmH]
MKRSLEFFPVQLFAVIMGLSGLTIAFAKAWHFLNINYFEAIYKVLLLLDTILFFVVFMTYIFKWIKYPEAVKKEFNHPVKSSFAAAISISFLLISIAYYDYAPSVSIIFWWVGAPLHLFFTYKVMKFWIEHKFEVGHINPAWFIPIVGNVLIPVVGVDAQPEMVNIFFYAIGIFFWLVLFTIVIYRMIFHNPLGKRLLPTFFILIAPPAVGFISYFRITFGLIDTDSLFLYFIALFIFVLLLTMFRQFIKLQFFISWWAYTFPMAALTIATILMDSAYDTNLTYYGALFLLAVTTLLVAYVTYKTFIAINNHKICIPEEE